MGKLLAMMGLAMMAIGCSAAVDSTDGATCTPHPTRDAYICEHFHGCGPFPLVLDEPQEWEVRLHTGPGCAEDDSDFTAAEFEAGQAGAAAGAAGAAFTQ